MSLKPSSEPLTCIKHIGYRSRDTEATGLLEKSGTLTVAECPVGSEAEVPEFVYYVAW